MLNINYFFQAGGILVFLVTILFLAINFFKQREVTKGQDVAKYKEDFFSINEELRTHISAVKEANVKISQLYTQVDKANSELNKKVDELHRINDISKTVSSTLKLKEVLEIILQEAIEWTKATHGSIMLIDQIHNTLRIKYAIGINPESIDKVKLKIGEGIAGWVIKEKKAVVIPSEIEDPRFKKFDHTSDVKSSLLSVPLIYRDKAIGVLNLSNRGLKESFGMDSLSFVTTIASHAAIAIENSHFYESIQHSYFETIKALTIALEAKDSYLAGHSERVTKYAKIIAKEMKLSDKDIRLIEYAGILHDIGKIGISEQILMKKSKLTPWEWGIIRKHTILGESIIEPMRFLSREREIVRLHHERYDGKGYPDGLSREEIPIHCRILSVADSFDSMTSDRPYRKALPVEQALKELVHNAGSQFDRNIVDAFIVFCDKNLDTFFEKRTKHK